MKTMQSLFSRLSDDLESKAGASEIEKALEDMTFKINQATDEQSKLQRLGRALGKDQNSSAAMKRLQIELEQVWVFVSCGRGSCELWCLYVMMVSGSESFAAAGTSICHDLVRPLAPSPSFSFAWSKTQARATAIMAMVPSDKDVLIGSRCLSCNRPLGGFSAPQVPKGAEEWYTGAGGLGGPKDRILEARGGSNGEVEGKSGGRGGAGAGIGSSRSPGRTQPMMTPAKILPADSASSEGPGAIPKKGPQGPLLFERTGVADGPGTGLKGRVLRGGGGGGGSTSTEGNVSISKVMNLEAAVVDCEPQALATGTRTERTLSTAGNVAVARAFEIVATV